LAAVNSSPPRPSFVAPPLAPAERRSRRRLPAVTLDDVARHARVSTATVSRVLNRKAVVAPEAAARVMQACAELGYLANGAARALSSNKTGTIGAVVPTIENAHFARGIAGLQSRLHAAGYTLLLASSFYDPEIELREVRSLLERGIDGLMLVGGERHTELERLLDRNIVPCVQTWTLSSTRPCVGLNHEAAAARLTDHLLDLGHERLAVIGGAWRQNDRAADRVSGIRQSLARRGLALQAHWFLERPYRIEEGRRGMRELLASTPAPTAVICGNDQLAFGALIEAQMQGLDVPRDISVAGFNDLDFAAYVTPTLTTVRVAADEIGRRAGDYLLARIAAEPAAPFTEIDAELVVRASTGAAPAVLSSQKT
jgi:LacI family transcriptional regulator